MIFIITMCRVKALIVFMLETLKSDLFRVRRQGQGKDNLVDSGIRLAANKIALTLILNGIEPDGDIVQTDAVFLAFFSLGLVNSFGCSR